MTLKDFFSLICDGVLIMFAAIIVVTIISLPFAVVLLLWKVVFA